MPVFRTRTTHRQHHGQATRHQTPSVLRALRHEQIIERPTSSVTTSFGRSLNIGSILFPARLEDHKDRTVEVVNGMPLEEKLQ